MPAKTDGDFDSEWLRLVAPPGYRNPRPQKRYHLIVIGAGPAGLVTAIAAAGLGARVALIERQRMGGDCLNVGCVPSKALLEATRRPDTSFETAFDWLRRTRAAIAAHDSVERYVAAGVDVFLGHARFVDAETVAVGELMLKGRRIVVATGARAALPPIPGLPSAQPLTNETVFSLTEKPRRIAILGAGPIGCELAQAFARLGIEVHLLETARRILVNESESAAAAVQRALAAAGVELTLGARVDGVERRGSQTAVTSGGITVVADRLLVAAGRKPNTEDLNLAAVDVQTDEHGLIVVDEKLRTTNRRIFAAGDVCSRLQFTHHADAQARAVVQNALFAPTARVDRLCVPRCVYTSPELAQVGPHRDELELANRAYDAYTVGFGELDRGRTRGDDGFVEILTAPGDAKILGATIVGEDAGELIAPVCVALANGLGVDALGKAMLPYPTRAEAFRRIADQRGRKRLTPATQRILARWFRWTG